MDVPPCLSIGLILKGVPINTILFLMVPYEQCKISFKIVNCDFCNFYYALYFGRTSHVAIC